MSCAHSRAKRVGWHLDRLLTNANTALTNVNTAHDPEGGDVSLSASRAERARLRSPLAVGMLIDERLDHRHDLPLLRAREL